ncbi:AraC family transcriptional regulator [Pseudoalteromonas rhizosphaerae]|uniref:Helix-turn-helix domain-containing protein n=2 Tax=Pseudoalteromonas TaxID=53246 RepID=A0ABW8L2G7_9GAMM
MNQFQYINDKTLNQFTLLDAKMTDFSYSKHAHEEYSLGVTLKGRQDFFSQRAFHKSPTGGVIVFNPEDVHDGHSGLTEHLEYVMLYVHPNEFEPMFKALGYTKHAAPRVATPLLADPQLAQQILALKQLTSGNNYTTIDTENTLFNIAHSIIKQTGCAIEPLGLSSRKDTLLLKAKDYIMANLGHDISIDDIAGVATMSKYHFIRLFNKQFGLTPYQYVVNCRINMARKYIESGARASQVALDSGFADNSHLNRHFKRIYGLTPKQYQLQLSL